MTTASEKLDAQAVQAVFVNRATVSVYSNFVRIAFAEATTDTPAIYRSAVVLPIEDAEDIVSKMQELLKVVKA
jgi:hypothetical protein